MLERDARGSSSAVDDLKPAEMPPAEEDGDDLKKIEVEVPPAEDHNVDDKTEKLAPARVHWRRVRRYTRQGAPLVVAAKTALEAARCRAFSSRR